MSLLELCTGGAWPILVRDVSCALNCVNVTRPSPSIASDASGQIGNIGGIAIAKIDESEVKIRSVCPVR